MPTVFINYRREESSGEARALFNDLVTHLGEDAVFMDVDSIAPGQDFRDVVHERVATCDVMLSLVGKEWLTVTSRSGARRLDEPGDFVRLEIEAALKRKIPVAPVLLHGAEMPAPESLPDALRDFAFRNAFELSHTRWESDVDEMLRRLRLLAPALPDGRAATGRGSVPAPAPAVAPAAKVAAAPGARSHTMPLVLALVAVMAIGAAAFLYLQRPAAVAGPIEPVAEKTTRDAPPAPSDGSTAGSAVDAAPVTPATVTAASGDVSAPAASPTAATAAAVTPGSAPVPTSPAAAAASPATAAASPAAARAGTSSASSGLPAVTGVPVGVPLALGNALVGPDSCLERLVFTSCANVPAQRWRLEAARGGLVRIHNVNAGPAMCLDLVPDGNIVVPGFAACGAGSSQRWSLTPAGAAARFFQLRNESTGTDMCLAVGRRPDQTLVTRMAGCVVAAGQRWRVLPQ